MENIEEKQVKFLKRIIRNLNHDVNILIINRSRVNRIIEDLKKSLASLLAEIEKERELSRQIPSFEFEKFFKECKKRMQKIEDEIERNQVITQTLILELKEKFSEQKKYENLLAKLEQKLIKQNKLEEQKKLDEFVEQKQMYIR